MELFEKATKEHVRFPYKGNSNTEDMWTAPLEDLDELYRALKAKQREQQSQDSLLNEMSPADKTLELQIAVIKHIVLTRKAERKAKEDAVANAEYNRRIDDLIAEKENEQLRNMSIEELRAQKKNTQ